MARAPLVTVPDEGAAWVVRDALTVGGVTAEVEPAGAEHPYAGNALARPMRIWVPAEQLERARSLLAALEEEIANDERDLAAQAETAGQGQAADVPATRRSGYWFLYFLIEVVIILLGAASYLANPDQIGSGHRDGGSWPFLGAWAAVWASLALVLTRAFGRRKVGRTVLVNIVAALLTGAIASLFKT
jgi:hypothetical protein